MSLEKKNKIKISTIIYSLLTVVFIYVICVGIAISFFPNIENVIIKKTAQFIPYPVATIGINSITAARLADDLSSVRSFYENQDFSDLGMRVDFSTSDGKKRLNIKEKEVLQKLIDNSIIENEAKKRKIFLTDAIVDQEVDRKLKEYGTSEYLKENLRKLYGWDMNDFKEKIVRPDLYREKLIEKIKKEDESYSVARKKIEEVKKDMQSEKDFAILAEKYSNGESAQKGGNLGWFSFNQMLPEVANVVFYLNKNETSDVIESSLGYHIIKIEDRRNENGLDMVNLSQIFIRAKSFPEWLVEKEKEYRIFILRQDYIWNKEKSEIEFKDKDMEKYEDDLFKNETDDPSMMF